jgi:hypothetical protein
MPKFKLGDHVRTIMSPSIEGVVTDMLDLSEHTAKRLYQVQNDTDLHSGWFTEKAIQKLG